MKAPSLQKTAALSAALHLTLFLLAAIVLRQSNHVNLPSPYVVDLVSPSRVARPHHSSGHVAPRESRRVKRALPARRPAETLSKKEKMKEKLIVKREAERVEDRIAELAAIKRIKEMTKLREVISIPAKGGESDSNQTTQPQAGKGTGQTVGSYMDRITGEIWKQWSWPDKQEKDLEAVISVLIAKDGTVTVQKIEKRSGNTLFDRSALTAIRSASPVTPPPDGAEMEIGIRFFL
jgi:colicin import membrane protein